MEYFLYVAIIVETALAAFVYKTVLQDADLARLSPYFGILYFGFLAWCIAQLNKLHRRRKLAQAEPIVEPVSEAAEPIANLAATETHTRPTLLGLTTAQLAIVVVVFASAVAAFTWVLGRLG
jgi:hypothetical protein